MRRSMKTKRKPKAASAAAIPTPPPDVAPKGVLVQPSAVSSTNAQRISSWNRWRERYNPLRSLGFPRAVTLLEQYQRGEMADPEWTFYFLEMTDADLVALVDRRVSALLELDWNAKEIPKLRQRKDFDQALADDQVAAINQYIDGIDNFSEAMAHLEMAIFRGFSHLEKWRNADGDVYHLELVDQWNMVRNLLRGPWRYNPMAYATTYEQISPDMDVVPENFLIYEVERPLDRLALIKFVRMNLSEKDWDAFIEIYGIPSGVIIMPPDVPKEKETDYQTAAQAIAQGGSGSLPSGSDYKPNSVEKGNNPFKERLDFLTEKLVLAGTGGELTMLSKPTGIGSGASDTHEEVFRKIARMDARKISELIQRQLIDAELDEEFPGQPHLAYFEIAPSEDVEPGDIADHTLKFANAGYKIDEAQLKEKTGYELVYAPLARINVREQGTIGPSGEAALEPGLTEKEAAAGAPPVSQPGKTQSSQMPGTMKNRADDGLDYYLGDYRAQFIQAFAGDLQKLRNAIEISLGGKTEEEKRALLIALKPQLPVLLREINQNGTAPFALAKAIAQAFASGDAAAAAERKA